MDKQEHIFRVPVDTQHFKDTVEEGKTFEEVKPFLSNDIERKLLQDLYSKTGKLRYWGSRPGFNNKKVFRKMGKDDELLLYRNKCYIAYAKIAFSMQNAALARYSWGEIKDGDTWELMYFFQEVMLDPLYVVGLVPMNRAFGYKESPVMGFSVLSNERYKQFMREHGSVKQFIMEQPKPMLLSAM